ncbi:hypothetical protein B0H17DRAFT_1127248 [Mycena rosella]|uniref:Uncharacterized protein n=1 Tax=Mycena rosella TaxID=1033263 RepID=A0AAD7DZY0_MYCRO|nr:hypothetical protein B0H17DRAFT_1127248 [Mycena rosella]
MQKTYLVDSNSGDTFRRRLAQISIHGSTVLGCPTLPVRAGAGMTDLVINYEQVRHNGCQGTAPESSRGSNVDFTGSTTISSDGTTTACFSEIVGSFEVFMRYLTRFQFEYPDSARGY